MSDFGETYFDQDNVVLVRRSFSDFSSVFLLVSLRIFAAQFVHSLDCEQFCFKDCRSKLLSSLLKNTLDF